MKSLLFVLMALQLGFATPAHSFSGELKDVMEQTGNVFNEVKKAVGRGDMSANTRQLAQELVSLLEKSATIRPDLSHITTDPNEQQRLLAQYQQMLGETAAVARELVTNIANGDLNAAKLAIEKLRVKRNEGHTIFKRDDRLN